VGATGHTVSQTVGAVNAAVKMQRAAEEHQNTQFADEYARAAAEQRLMEEGLRAMWRVGKIEVEGVLRRMCSEILTEGGVAASVLKNRAQAMKELGRCYRTAVTPPGAESNPLQRKKR
jgi:X-domain of DnaJ-containing